MEASSEYDDDAGGGVILLGDEEEANEEPEIELNENEPELLQIFYSAHDIAKRTTSASAHRKEPRRFFAKSSNDSNCIGKRAMRGKRDRRKQALGNEMLIDLSIFWQDPLSRDHMVAA